VYWPAARRSPYIGGRERSDGASRLI
jgi:hypothetical protein